MSGVVHTADVPFQLLRVLHFHASSPAGLEIPAHAHESVRETGLLFEEEGAKLRREGARDPARHASAEHIVEARALLIRDESQGRDPALKECSEVLLCGLENLDPTA